MKRANPTTLRYGILLASSELVTQSLNAMPVPMYDGLFNPLLRAMRELGGSASVAEQEDKVAQLLKLSEQEASEIHRGNRSKLSYRLAWARNYLKRAGLLENSSRGIWALTAKGKSIQKVGSAKINREIKAL